MNMLVKEKLNEGEKTYTITENFGDTVLVFEVHSYDGESLDTSVKIGDKMLCWITYADKNVFINELQETISKYRI